jgi:hypothetical protein
LSLVLALRCFQRLGYFPSPADVPVTVVEHIRRGLGLPKGTTAFSGSETGKWQRRLVRERLGVVLDPERARAVATDAIRSAAEVKNDPPDLINVALEMLVKESLELPAFSTLDEISSRIRREVNTGMFEQIDGRIGLPDRVGLGVSWTCPALLGRRRSTGSSRWRGGRHGLGCACRSSTCDGLTRSATPPGGWRASRSQRSPTSPARRWPLTPA